MFEALVGSDVGQGRDPELVAWLVGLRSTPAHHRTSTCLVQYGFVTSRPVQTDWRDIDSCHYGDLDLDESDVIGVCPQVAAVAGRDVDPEHVPALHPVRRFLRIVPSTISFPQGHFVSLSRV